VTNGLLLRTDIHRLFDKGYVTISNDGRFEVGQRLKLTSRTAAIITPCTGKQSLHPVIRDRDHRVNQSNGIRSTGFSVEADPAEPAQSHDLDFFYASGDTQLH
jgi:HNH endonuclease